MCTCIVLSTYMCMYMQSFFYKHEYILSFSTHMGTCIVFLYIHVYIHSFFYIPTCVHSEFFLQHVYMQNFFQQTCVHAEFYLHTFLHVYIQSFIYIHMYMQSFSTYFMYTGFQVTIALRLQSTNWPIKFCKQIKHPKHLVTTSNEIHNCRLLSY
jgi:hypothetical protein